MVRLEIPISQAQLRLVKQIFFPKGFRLWFPLRIASPLDPETQGAWPIGPYTSVPFIPNRKIPLFAGPMIGDLKIF